MRCVSARSSLQVSALSSRAEADVSFAIARQVPTMKARFDRCAGRRAPSVFAPHPPRAPPLARRPPLQATFGLKYPGGTDIFVPSPTAERRHGAAVYRGVQAGEWLYRCAESGARRCNAAATGRSAARCHPALKHSTRRCSRSATGAVRWSHRMRSGCVVRRRARVDVGAGGRWRP